MTHGISYVRAVTSCLPVVGPIFSAFNAVIARLESLGAGVRLFALSATLQSVMEAEPRMPERENELLRDIDGVQTDIAKILKREIVYSKCAIAGSLLTLIGVVALVAAGVLAGPLAWVYTIGLAISTIAHSYNLHMVNKEAATLSRCRPPIGDLAHA